MRRPLLFLAASAAVLLVLAVVGWRALAGGDALDSLKRPEPAQEPGRAHHFDVERIASGLNRPTWVGAAPGDDGGLWVLEQPGRVVRIAGTRRRTLLDLSGQVLTGAEQGLLGIAFHPDFMTDRRLYLHWSDRRGDTRVAEFRARRDGTIDPTPLRRLLFVDQPEENHNGGQLAFGPDGRLYLGLGDGGGAFDPDRHAQDPRSLLGKLIATRVDGGRRDWEVVLTGLRNPWRFWFDPALGEVWIGDVGQDEVEEVDRVLLERDEPPKNLGWSAFEGTKPHRPPRARPRRRPRVARRHLLARRGLLDHRRPDLRRRRACPASHAATSTATSAPAPCGRCGRRPGGAASTTSGASAPRCRSSPTSASTPTASWCSRRPRARSTGP